MEQGWGWNREGEGMGMQEGWGRNRAGVGSVLGWERDGDGNEEGVRTEMGKGRNGAETDGTRMGLETKQGWGWSREDGHRRDGDGKSIGMEQKME